MSDPCCHPGAPSMDLGDIIAGLSIAIEVALAVGADLRESGGQTD